MTVSCAEKEPDEYVFTWDLDLCGISWASASHDTSARAAHNLSVSKPRVTRTIHKAYMLYAWTKEPNMQKLVNRTIHERDIGGVVKR